MGRGSRSSDWQVMRRCLAIICRVQRGPCNWHALVEAVCSVEGAEAYGETSGAALQRRVQNDLHRIRENLLVEINFSRQAGGYVIAIPGSAVGPARRRPAYARPGSSASSTSIRRSTTRSRR